MYISKVANILDALLRRSIVVGLKKIALFLPRLSLFSQEAGMETRGYIFLDTAIPSILIEASCLVGHGV